ncbi:MAG: hypothetical protein WD650_03915 [Nitrosopumilaceae archaeon]
MDKIRCKCSKCECQEEFEIMDKEQLLNAIHHGRLNPKQIEFAKKRIGTWPVNDVLLENIRHLHRI